MTLICKRQDSIDDDRYCDSTFVDLAKRAKNHRGNLLSQEGEFLGGGSEVIDLMRRKRREKSSLDEEEYAAAVKWLRPSNGLSVSDGWPRRDRKKEPAILSAQTRALLDRRTMKREIEKDVQGAMADGDKDEDDEEQTVGFTPAHLDFATAKSRVKFE